MSASTKRQLSKIIGKELLNVKLSRTGDIARPKLIQALVRDRKLVDAMTNMFTQITGTCPTTENLWPQDPQLGDLQYILNRWYTVSPEKRGSVTNFLEVLFSSSGFFNMGRSRTTIESNLRSAYSMPQPSTFVEPKPTYGGESYHGQPTPSDTSQRHEVQKSGNAQIVSNLSAEQGKGQLEPATVHPDALRTGQSLPVVTSIQDAMNDLSTAVPEQSTEVTTQMSAPTVHQDQKLIATQPTNKPSDYFHQPQYVMVDAETFRPPGMKDTDSTVQPQEDKKPVETKGVQAEKAMKDLMKAVNNNNNIEAKKLNNVTANQNMGVGTGQEVTPGGTPGINVKPSTPPEPEESPSQSEVTFDLRKATSNMYLSKILDFAPLPPTTKFTVKAITSALLVAGNPETQKFIKKVIIPHIQKKWADSTAVISKIDFFNDLTSFFADTWTRTFGNQQVPPPISSSTEHSVWSSLYKTLTEPKPTKAPIKITNYPQFGSFRNKYKDQEVDFTAFGPNPTEAEMYYLLLLNNFVSSTNEIRPWDTVRNDREKYYTPLRFKDYSIPPLPTGDVSEEYSKKWNDPSQFLYKPTSYTDQIMKGNTATIKNALNREKNSKAAQKQIVNKYTNYDRERTDKESEDVAIRPEWVSFMESVKNIGSKYTGYEVNFNYFGKDPTDIEAYALMYLYNRMRIRKFAGSKVSNVMDPIWFFNEVEGYQGYPFKPPSKSVIRDAGKWLHPENALVKKEPGGSGFEGDGIMGEVVPYEEIERMRNIVGINYPGKGKLDKSTVPATEPPPETGRLNRELRANKDPAEEMEASWTNLYTGEPTAPVEPPITDNRNLYGGESYDMNDNDLTKKYGANWMDPFQNTVLKFKDPESNEDTTKKVKGTIDKEQDTDKPVDVGDGPDSTMKPVEYTPDGKIDVKGLPLLRPSFAEGGADIITDINKDKTLELYNRLTWQAFNNYGWEANEEFDNPFHTMNYIDLARRFGGPLDKEELLTTMAIQAIEEEHASNKVAYNIPEEVKRDGEALLLDTRGGVPLNTLTRDETNEQFHDVYMPPWIEVPEDSGWKQFTQVEGTQLPDSMLRNSTRLSGNDWPKLAMENAFIYNTVA